MPLRKSVGNMYDWTTHVHSHLAGQCVHKCLYCYVQRGRAGKSKKYKGKIRFLEEELKVNYGSDRIIFIEYMSDLFATKIPEEFIKKILAHCCRYPDNQYVFQTKNPFRALIYKYALPPDVLIGTTIETNRNINSISKAPFPSVRYLGIKQFTQDGYNTFVTIEPILDFDVEELSQWIIEIYPNFVNIGADSKHSNLQEPSREKILKLVDRLKEHNITIKKKSNLDRLLEGGE